MNGLDLFSGIGGISLALKPWVRTVAYCEIDRYAQAVLLSRMAEGAIDRAPIWDDVRTLKGDMLPKIDIISGGFPCQDISVAGAGAGLGGERSGLFFEIMRLAGELRPSFVFLENVPAITVRGLDRVCLELTSLGYDCRWTIVSAAELGAPHLRERWWLLARANGSTIREREQRSERRRLTVQESEKAEPEHDGSPYADSLCEGLERWVDACQEWEAFALGGGGGGSEWPHWLPQPSLCRGDNGLSYRVDRLRCLGNSVVPQAAREAFRRLVGENK